MKRVLGIVGAIGIVVLMLNVAGVLRYPGGPLREPSADGPLWLDIRPADQGGSATGNLPEADWARTNTDLIFSGLWLSNPSPWAASVEAITPIDVGGALVTREVLVENVNAADGGDLYGYGPVPTEQRALLDRHYAALPAVIAPGESGRHAALIVRGSTPGAAGFEALAIDYRLGPFAFRVIHHVALHACLGATVKERMCPEYD